MDIGATGGARRVRLAIRTPGFCADCLRRRLWLACWQMACKQVEGVVRLFPEASLRR